MLSSVITRGLWSGQIKAQEITNLITEGMTSQIDLKASFNIAPFLSDFIWSGCFIKLYAILHHLFSDSVHFSKRMLR